jgi:hypothetical protein
MQEPGLQSSTLGWREISQNGLPIHLRIKEPQRMVRGMLKMRNVRSKGTFHIPLGTVRNLSSVPRPLHPSLKRTVSTRPTDLTRLSVPVWIGPKRGTVKVRRLCLFQNMTIVASSAFKYVLILGFILEIWKCIFSNF